MRQRYEQVTTEYPVHSENIKNYTATILDIKVMEVVEVQALFFKFRLINRPSNKSESSTIQFTSLVVIYPSDLLCRRV